MNYSIFTGQVKKIEGNIPLLSAKVSKTLSIMERILNNYDSIDIKEWKVINGEIYVIFVSPIDLDNISPLEKPKVDAIKALFPNAKMCKRSIEISFNELI